MAYRLVNALYYYFWLATPVIQLFTAWWMFRRKLARDFPFFVSYLAYAAVTGLSLFALAHLGSARNTSIYGAAYELHLLGCLFLRFCVIYEIVRQVLRSYPSLHSLLRLLFRLAFALLLLIGVLIAAYAPGDSVVSFSNFIWVIERTASLIQIGLLVLLLMFSSYFKLSWREYVFGMALGLGVYASMELALASVYANMWAQATNTLWRTRVLDLMDMGTYHICVLTWMAYLLSPERKSASQQVLPQTDLTAWNAELDRLARP